MTTNQVKILGLIMIVLFIAGFLYTKRFKEEPVVVPPLLPAPTLMPSMTPMPASPSARVR